ncbi:11305_t:CDS:2 [Gigaspora margarita]|uniref:11305_t:CDS:1 n=1 Tax=Gigaspora margarita TaxID=4874 RepID=A0ABN7VD39_GIGMA|nr:11305_t:CDS:2 [Gigaspora margarita]
MVNVVLEKVKVHSEDKQNERANRIAKEGDEANILIKVKWIITKSMVFRPVLKEIEIECFLIEFIKQLLMIATRAKLYQDVQYRKCKEEKESFEHLSTCPYNKEAWAKKEEKILDSIKEELKQKEKIDLGSNWLREVFIPRDKEEYRNRHIEWSKGFSFRKNEPFQK